MNTQNEFSNETQAPYSKRFVALIYSEIFVQNPTSVTIVDSLSITPISTILRIQFSVCLSHNVTWMEVDWSIWEKDGL